MTIFFECLEDFSYGAKPSLDLSISCKQLNCKTAEAIAGKMNGRSVSIQLHRTTLEKGVMEILANALLKAEKIEGIYLNGCQITNEELAILTETLKGKAVERFHLTNNPLNDEGFNILSTLLKTALISKVGFAYNDFGPTEAERLIRAFSQNPEGELIDLSENQIGDDGAEKIAQALANNPGKINTVLLYNCDIGLDGDLALANLVPASVLNISHRLDQVDFQTLEKEDPARALLLLARPIKFPLPDSFTVEREGLIHERKYGEQEAPLPLPEPEPELLFTITNAPETL